MSLIIYGVAAVAAAPVIGIIIVVSGTSRNDEGDDDDGDTAEFVLHSSKMTSIQYRSSLVVKYGPGGI
jgi:hypothetical protein